jgi:EmrB/QacA subfamily drug resistance transporter
VSKWPATIAAMLGMMTTIMASTMANVAIADIMGAFGIGQDRAHWVSTGFLSATTACMLLNAWFIHNVGARNTFLVAGAIFAVACLVGQLAPTYEGVVIARVGQGIGAGLLQPLALSVIFMVFPPEERGKAMGWFGVGVMLGPALGPLYGGLIIDALSWRYVFVGSLPFMAVAAGLALRYLPGREREAPRFAINWLSLSLVVIAMTMFLNGITHGQREGWDSLGVRGLLLTAALATLAFIEVESRTRRPLLNLRLFTRRSFAVVSLVGFVFGAGMFGSFYLMPIFVRTVQGFTGTKAGLLLLAADLVTFVVFPIAGWLAQRVNPMYPVAFGMLVFGISSLALSTMDADSAFSVLVGWSALGRIGLGLAIPALSAAGLQGLDRNLVAYGAGTMTFIRMLGGAIGVNALAIVLDMRSAYYFDQLAATQTALTGATRSLVAGVIGILGEGGVSSAERLPYAMVYLAEVIAARANALSFQDGYLVLAGAFAIAAICALTLAPRRAGGK